MVDNSLLPVENIKLEVSSFNHVAINGIEEWQFDTLIMKTLSEGSSSLGRLDSIPTLWFDQLSPKVRFKIFAQQSLQGIPIPDEWIAMWRIIIKTSELRDPERATKGGSKVGSDQHIWNLWSNETLHDSLDDMEIELIKLNDFGEPHMSIGCSLIEKYGDLFYKPRKKDATTTPAKVVNYYFSIKLPTKVARATLCEHALNILNRNSSIKMNKNKKNRRASK